MARNAGEWDAWPDIVIKGRPDFANRSFGITRAKKFPPYVYSSNRMGSLVHKIHHVDLWWWTPDPRNGGSDLVRLKRPRMLAHTACGNVRFLTSDRARTCIVPKPDAILCGRCHGDVHTFGKDGWATKAGITRTAANAKLGCIVQGY